MSMNEADTRYHLIAPVLRDKGYVSRDHITLETVLTPPPVEPSGPKGRRRKGPGRTDYLLCVKVGDASKPMPVAVLEAKKEAEDPLKGMQQARGYADTLRFDVKYVFSTNGHRYGEYDRFTELINGPTPFCDFPSRPDLTARYYKDTGIDLTQPGFAMLFQADSAAWSQSRYYQDAAIRASFEKILLDRQAGKPPRVLLTLATGAGKTIIATNLLWRLSQASQLPKPALFLCDRDELREQVYTKLKAAFGDNARIVRTERGSNAAANARIHIATYQTLGLDDEEGFASFLTEHYGEDAFSVIIIDECHRSAWGRWSEVLRRNPSAIHIGLTATPRKLEESDKASKEDQEITANNRQYFGEPVYEYTLIQAQEDGYLAACEIVKRKASIDSATFTKKEILNAGVRDIRTGQPLTEADLTKDEYTGKDFDDELFIELRTPKMCADLFELLCENGGPEQKVIIFCTREIHADGVAQHMNNLYVRWCKKRGHTPKDHYAFKCMGGANNGADMIEPMRGSGERAFIACTVDLLEAGVDIERLNAVVFSRYLQSPIKFYQMVGRGTRIHEETQKYKFWLYDYTDVSSLFGTDFITKPPRPGGGGRGDGGDTGGGGEGDDGPHVAEMRGQYVVVNAQGRFILSRRGGRDTPIPVDEYRREVIQRVIAEANNLDEFRALWIETQKRRSLINQLLGDNFSAVTCAIVLDEGLLFRTNESAFVETKRKLVDECELWAILSLPGGVFSTAGAGVKTNLLFFTKGRKTERIWNYDLSQVKVGKKTPLTLAHFGFAPDGEVLDDAALPAALVADWQADESNASKPFPSYARQLARRGTPEAESRWSWTVDFAARRAKAREEMQPLLDGAAKLKAEVVDLKEQLKRLKKDKAADDVLEAHDAQIREKDKAARDLEAQAAAIDAAVFDLKAVNPNAVATVDVRTPAEIIASIDAQGRIVAQALARLHALLASDAAATDAQRAV